MIVGIGIDIIEVERIREQMAKQSGLDERLFSAGEIEYCHTKARSAEHFAARYAAKEAFMKALGTGWREGIAFREIEVVHDQFGKPGLVLSGKAQQAAQSCGVATLTLSLSHTKQLATAIVMLES